MSPCSKTTDLSNWYNVKTWCVQKLPLPPSRIFKGGPCQLRLRCVSEAVGKTGPSTALAQPTLTSVSNWLPWPRELIKALLLCPPLHARVLNFFFLKHSDLYLFHSHAVTLIWAQELVRRSPRASLLPCFRRETRVVDSDLPFDVVVPKWLLKSPPQAERISSFTEATLPPREEGVHLSL